MKYMLKGYVFDENSTSYPITGHFLVSGWDEAERLIKSNGFQYYIITLDEIEEE